MPTKRQEAMIGRCKAKTKAGRPCAAPAIRDAKFCSSFELARGLNEIPVRLDHFRVFESLANRAHLWPSK